MAEKFKIMLSFDVDAETLWTSKDADEDGKNKIRPSLLSQGEYGPKVAVPRILKLLDRYEIKSSFFIPGWTAEHYPEMVEEIYKRGHEIGNHGYSHTSPDSFETKDEEIWEYQTTSEIIEKITGEKPKGFRGPSWEFSVNTLAILKDMGFVYDSTMMNSDQVGMLSVFGENSDIVEIPINWTLDDAPFWLLSGQDWGAAMQPPSAVFEIWTKEFEYLYKESFDNVFVLTCHPQIIGRPNRFSMYEELVDYLVNKDKVEFLTCIQTAEDYLK